MDFEYDNTVVALAHTSREDSASHPTSDTLENVIQEEFRISGDALIYKIEELMNQGNIRRIKIQNQEGYTLLTIPIARLRLSGDVNSFNVPEATSTRVIGAMVERPKVIVEWQLSCPISCSLMTVNSF
ncbi:MAG: DUF4342 domain-containing protein [Cyanobacteria bacterium J06555_13]